MRPLPALLIVIGATLAPGALYAQGPQPAPVYVTMFSHFDAPWNMSSADLTGLRLLSANHPGMRWTHLWNPAGYTQSTPLLAAIEAYLVESRDLHGAEIGVHTHMYSSLVLAAGVPFHSSPSVNGGPPGCCCDSGGYAVPTSSYSYDQISSILRFTVDKFLERGLCRPRSYCAGYYTTNLDLQRALVDLDFTTSAAAFPPGTTIGTQYGPCWDLLSGWDSSVTHMTEPYPVSASTILPGGPAPYLQGDLGPLYEIPQTSKIDWMLSASDMQGIFLDHYNLALSGTPTAVSFAMHEELAAGEWSKFDTVLDYVAQMQAAGGAPVIYVTAAELREAFLGLSGTGSFGAFLATDATQLSVGAGGVQDLAIDTCPPDAGSGCAVLGSISGTAPGLPLGGGLVLPLVPDAYLNLTITTLAATAPPVLGSIGSLDPAGTAAAQVVLPAGSSPTWVGTTLHHAAVVFDPTSYQARSVTNAVAVTLVP